MVDSSVLCEIDLVTSEHLISSLLQSRFLSQVDQKAESVIGQEVLGEVEEDLRAIGAVLEGSSKLLEALRVFLEVFLQHDVTTSLIVMLYKSLPGLEFGSLREARHDGVVRISVGCEGIEAAEVKEIEVVVNLNSLR